MRVSSLNVQTWPAVLVCDRRRWLIRWLTVLAAICPILNADRIPAAAPSAVPAESAAESPRGEPADIPLRWLRRPAADAGGHAWYRFAFGQGDPGSRQILTLAATGRCSISVNGQRILKHQ